MSCMLPIFQTLPLIALATGHPKLSWASRFQLDFKMQLHLEHLPLWVLEGQSVSKAFQTSTQSHLHRCWDILYYGMTMNRANPQPPNPNPNPLITLFDPFGINLQLPPSISGYYTLCYLMLFLVSKWS